LPVGGHRSLTGRVSRLLPLGNLALLRFAQGSFTLRGFARRLGASLAVGLPSWRLLGSWRLRFRAFELWALRFWALLFRPLGLWALLFWPLRFRTLRLGSRHLLGKLLRPGRLGLPTGCGGPSGRLLWLYRFCLARSSLRSARLRLWRLGYPGDLRNREVGA